MSPRGASTALRASYESIYAAQGIQDQQQFYAWIIRLIRARRDWRVLDVACGEGGLLAAAQARGLAPYGIDISSEALRRAQGASSKAVLAQASAEALPWADASFDCVTCLGSLENFLHPTRALAEIRRVLRTDGVLCAMMPNRFWLGDVLQVMRGREEQPPFQYVERTATARQWQAFLEGAGFIVDRRYGYTKVSPLLRGGKLRSLRKYLLTRALRSVSPPALAWSIVYIAHKGRPQPRQRGWWWRAERFGDEARGTGD